MKYILDEIPGCVGAWGTKRLRRDFVSSPINLRKASDNSEIDIPSCGKNLCNVAIDKHLAVTMTNILGVEGNFEGDNLDYWSKYSITGIMEQSTNDFKTGTKSLHVKNTEQTSVFQRDIPGTTSDKVYTCCFVKKISGNATQPTLRLFDYQSNTNPIYVVDATQMNNASGGWTFYSNIKVLNNNGIRIYLGAGMPQTLEYYIDSIISINLTAVFGAGNEPAQSAMDTLVQSIGYFSTYQEAVTNGYITTLRDTTKEKYVKLVNFLEQYGNLQTDSNSDGLADGYTLTGLPTNLSVSNGVQTFTPGTGETGVYKSSTPSIAGNVYYMCAYITTTGYAKLQFRASAASYPNTWVNAGAQDKFMSVRGVATENWVNIYPWILGISTNSTAPISFRRHMMFNLTAIFGVGGEPTQAQMDTMVQRALAEGYFTEKNAIRPTDAITAASSNQPKWTSSGIKFDGMDDYYSIPNYPEIDIVNPPMSIVLAFNPTNYNGYLLCKNTDASTNIQYGAFLISATKQIAVYFNGLSQLGLPIPDAGKDVVVTIVWSNGKLQGYVNGVLSSSADLNGPILSAPYVTMGRRQTSAAYYASAINQIMIFNRALTEREINKITKYFI